MTHTIIYSNYKFDIILEQTSVTIKVFDTITMNLYEGIVNENEIYVNPICKFVKLLVSALENQPDFSIGITKSNNAFKCQLQYKTAFIELEETFLLTQVSNTQEVEYHMWNKINELESKYENLKQMNLKMSEQFTKLTDCVNSLLNENKELKYKIKQSEVREVVEQVQHGGPVYKLFKYVPINDVHMQITDGNQLYPFGSISIVPNNPNGYSKWIHGIHSAKNEIDVFTCFNINKIIIYDSYRDGTFNTSFQPDKKDFLNAYLNVKKTYVFDEIQITAYSSQARLYFEILRGYNNYKKIKISVQDALYNKLAFDAHCKTNNIEIEYGG